MSTKNKKVSRKYSKYSKTKAARAERMREDGSSLTQVADYLGCAMPTAKSWLERYAKESKSVNKPTKKPKTVKKTNPEIGPDASFLRWWQIGLINSWFDRVNEILKGKQQ